MTKTLLILVLVVAASAIAIANDVEEKEEIKKTLKFQGPSETRKVLVDNIRGSIEIRGYDGDDVELVVHRTNYAESQDKLAEARKEVTLDIREENDRILLYVDAPWRTDHGINYRGWRYYGYDVECSFELRVPRKSNVYVKTVNKGDISVENIDGEFEAQNVNGAIAMKNIGGSGKACTVNGGVEVLFSKSPTSECTFKTVNGRVNVEFPADLAADLNLKTFNGSVYTDFDFTDLPRKMEMTESHGGKKIYMRDKSFAVRVGKGGPELTFDTLNGSIHILKREDYYRSKPGVQ